MSVPAHRRALRAAGLACSVAVIVSACTSQQDKAPTGTHGWSAVGVSAGRAPSLASSTNAPPVTGPSSTRLPVATSTSAAGTGRSSSSGPPWGSGPGAAAFPVPGAVDQRSASAVALGGAAAAASADTTIDGQPNSTVVRAAQAGWFTPAYARANIEAGVLPGPAGVQWNTWAKHHAFARVQVGLGGDDHPADTAESAVRQVIVTQTPIGRDGWRGAPVTTVEVLVLHMIDKAWRIDDIHTI